MIQRGFPSIYRGGILLLVILLRLCQHFLDGAEIKKSIEDQIAYSNAPSFTITVDAPIGTGIVKSPAGGQTEKKVTDTFAIDFEAGNDWEFIRWKIMDSTSKTELANGEYLSLSSITDPETECKFVKSPSGNMKLSLVPVMAERPQIISYTPTASNIYKDSSIQVLFDYKYMDDSSLYFTEKEMQKLIENGTADKSCLPEILDGNTIYRGYKKDGFTYYKNVTIRNNKTEKIINDCFLPPVFENNNILSIKADKDHLVDSFSQVLVTIGKGICYKVQIDENTSKTVEMAGSKKWMYQVNGKTDKEPLVIAQDDGADVFEVKGFNSGEERIIQQETSHPVSNTNSSSNGISTLRFLKDGKIRLKLQLDEVGSGSGPASQFTVMLKKVYNENYDRSSSSTIEKPVDFQVCTADTGIYDDYLDMSDWGLADGVYEMSFIFKDRTENPTTYPTNINYKYYIAKDGEKPALKTHSFTTSNSTTYKLNWTPTMYDIQDVKLSVKRNEEEPEIVQFSPNNPQAPAIENITPNNAYELKLIFKDYAGHESEEIIPKFLTGYVLSGTPAFTGTDASHVPNVFFANDYIGYYGLSLKKYYSDGSSVDLTSSTKIPTKSYYNSSSSLSYSLTENGVSKTAATANSYYTAKKDSLTQTIVRYSGYNGTHGTNANYYKFGDWPQTIRSKDGEAASDDAPQVSVTSTTIYNGWYLGSDGYFYAKCQANPRDTNLSDNMSDGTWIQKDKYYYFKVEPIVWRQLGSSKILFSEKALDGVLWYTSSNNRTIGNKTIYPNNYKYSTVRAFLNGSYESGDSQSRTYSGCGFYQYAFTSTAKNYISTTTVDNSPKSTNPYQATNHWNNGKNDYACDQTNDKVFLLSTREISTPDYGFPDPYKKNGESYRLNDVTDYAKARNVFSAWSTDFYTRSPAYDGPRQLRPVNSDGYAVRSREIFEFKDNGIVPAITVTSLP